MDQDAFHPPASAEAPRDAVGYAQTLEQTEQLFRFLIEGVKEYAIFMLDHDNRVISWNAGAQRILGYTESEILGQSAAVFFTPEDRATGEYQKEILTALKDGQAQDVRWHLRKDGSRFWASGVLTTMVDPDGALRGYAKIMRDNTRVKEFEIERQRLLDAEKAARAQAEQANRAKDDFLATVSHELRTPLTAILGWARLLTREPGLSPSACEALAAIERSTTAQSVLIEDILDISRITAGTLRINPRLISLEAPIRDAAEMLRPSADIKHIGLTLTLQSTSPLNGDPERLQQVIVNVLSNAIKFTPAHGRITVTLEQRDSLIAVVISDSGRGITSDFLPYVFDRFRQADSSTTRTRGGLGLGLAIARHLVELHGGTIKVASAGENAGSTFTIFLPIALPVTVPQSPQTAGKPAKVSLRDNPTPLTGMHVLLVDDEPELRRVLAAILKIHGAKVTATASAHEAVDACRQASFDVLISDIGMPQEDGYSLLRRIRALDPAPNHNLPAIALTAYTRADDRIHAQEAGFQTFVAKPIDPDQLVQVVLDLIAAPKA